MSRNGKRAKATAHDRDSAGGLIYSATLWIVYLCFTIPVVIAASGALLFGGADRAHAVHLWWCRASVRLFGIRLTVVNPDRVVRDRPVVYISNHQSILDILIAGAVLNTRYRWLAKAELFRIPLLGWGMRRTGYVPVERGSGEKSRRSFYKAAEQIRDGNSLVIFPEGTVTTTGSVLPFRRGGFIIAQAAAVTVQCLSISGTIKLLPDQEDRRIPRFSPGPVRVFVHPPIEPDQFANLALPDFMDLARAQMASEVAEHHESAPGGKT